MQHTLEVGFVDGDLTEVPVPDLQANVSTKTQDELASIVSEFASSERWIERVRLRSDERWYERIYRGPDYDLWVISWLPGQSTGFHDHGASCGAFAVATGVLEEHCIGEQPHQVRADRPRAFGKDHTHDVRNNSSAPAVSIHAYSPPLEEMNEYDLEGSGLVPRARAQAKTAPAWRAALTIDQLLLAARERLERLSPDQVHDAMGEEEMVLVDIRPESQRAIEGLIPDALIVERNVLEWRFDPTSSSRLSIATSHDLRVVVFCSEGYTSSLAASALKDLGLWRATDLIGGIAAWKAAGMPWIPHHPAAETPIVQQHPGS